jgi:hypothetical protein
MIDNQRKERFFGKSENFFIFPFFDFAPVPCVYVVRNIGVSACSVCELGYYDLIQVRFNLELSGFGRICSDSGENAAILVHFCLK